MKACLIGIKYFTIAFLACALLFISFRLKISKPDRQTMPEWEFSETITLADQMLPLLEHLTRLKYFRYFRVDLTLECESEVSNQLCTEKRKCSLCPCPEENLPKAWLDEDFRLREARTFNRYGVMEHVFDKPGQGGGRMVNGPAKDVWKLDQISEFDTYVDLHSDMESYTGYQGQRIWEVIYKEHCQGFYDMCTENRLLHRLISGMHSSVSSHLSFYFDSNPNPEPGIDKVYKPNLGMYIQKVGAYPERMGNLVFAISVLVDGISRYASEISDFKITLDDLNEELKTKQALKQLMFILAQSKETLFAKSRVFSKPMLKQVEMEQFTNYYKRIVRIMDCVDCQKCKVYGKMQVLGLTVALRKLLNEGPTQLTRNELVALVNTLKKWVESIKIMRVFGEDMQKRKRDLALCMIGMTLLVVVLINKFLGMSGKSKVDRKRIEEGVVSGTEEVKLQNGRGGKERTRDKKGKGAKRKQK